MLFARYAYGPNRLGLCGPDAAASLFGESTEGGDERELRRLAAGFDGAFPYLELIARANGIADPLDARVVDAYWLGSSLLARVSADELASSLAVRFRPRLDEPAWRWLRASAPAGAKPVHAFHVLDVFPKVGLLRSGHVGRVVEMMDRCRIRWGRMRARDGDQLVVDAVPLGMVDGRLALLPPRVERVTGWRDGRGFVNDVAPGDVVSIHWDWACETLSPARLRRLVEWTRGQLEVANLSV
ncbi:MAG TPA: DUF6390 family protein [Candidatus Limnocylindrales bacterium]|nr:DUF6390 family protein [Candidatus Limnocylindrales bacterium]